MPSIPPSCRYRLPVVDFLLLLPVLSIRSRRYEPSGYQDSSCSVTHEVMGFSRPRRRAWLSSDHCGNDDLAAGGRPGPWMRCKNVIALGIDAVAHRVKVDDAAPGISEGLNAGWTVGLAVSVTNSAQHALSDNVERVTLRSAAESTRPASCTPPGALRGGFTGGFTREIASWLAARLAQGERVRK